MLHSLTLSSLLYWSIWASLSVVSLSSVSSWSFSLRQFTPLLVTDPVREVKVPAAKQRQELRSEDVTALTAATPASFTYVRFGSG